MPTKHKACDPSEAVNRIAAKLAEHEQPLASSREDAGKARRRRIKLSELSAQMKPEHRHGEWDLGDPVGREVW